MITYKDVDKLKEAFVTKKELAQLRIDERFDEMNEKVDGLITMLHGIDQKTDERFDVMNEKVDGLITMVHGFIGHIDDLQRENEAGGNIFSRHGRQIEALAQHTGATLPD